jgi:hypothetical protein
MLIHDELRERERERERVTHKKEEESSYFLFSSL